MILKKMNKSIIFRKILAVVILIIFILLLFSSRMVFKPLILSIILSYILNPLVKKLEKMGLSKRISSIFTVLIVMLIFSLIIIYIIPGIIKELMGIINNFGEFNNIIKSIKDFVGYKNIPEYLKEVVNATMVKVQNSFSNYINILFGNVLDFAMELPTYFLAPIFTYYFLADKDFFKRKISFFIPLRFREKSFELTGHISRVVQGYFLSQVLLSLIVFVFTFIALIIIDIKYPLLIAIFNGVANFIPYFGPLIGYAPAVLLALSESTDKAVMVTIAFFLIQQIEANIISPKLVSDCTGMHPVEVMIVLLVGGHFFGGMGMVFSVPVAATIKISYKYIVRNMY